MHSLDTAYSIDKILWNNRSILALVTFSIAAVWWTELQANPAAKGHLLPGLCGSVRQVSGEGKAAGQPSQSSLFTAHCWDSPGESKAGSHAHIPPSEYHPATLAWAGIQAIKHNIWSCSVVVFANSLSQLIFDNWLVCLFCLTFCRCSEFNSLFHSLCYNWWLDWCKKVVSIFFV